MHGLIIDDPVSSLDHIRLRRVATRLVEEAAKGRQVIIFTHNIHFFNEVCEEAARSQPQVKLAKNYIRSIGNETFGMISDIKEPWIIMPTTKRITVLRERLKNFETITDFSSESWRGTAKEFYSDLRETWERFVEENVLGKTVERFKAEVKTQSLKDVVMEDTDYQTIYLAMRHVSERSGHDMATGKNLPLPKPDEMKRDIEALDTFRVEISKRQDAAAKRRKKMQEAPVADVA